MNTIDASRAQDFGAARPSSDDYVNAPPGLHPRQHRIIALHVFSVGLARLRSIQRHAVAAVTRSDAREVDDRCPNARR